MAVTGEVTAAPEVAGFELGRVIARGGTSEVWEGVREADGRRLAVKVALAERDAVAAAVREASLSSAAADAHVVPVEACLPLPDGRVALVMPLVRGGDLASLVAARGHLGAGEVVTALAPVASAVGRLHRVGAVHGDLSPGNVLLDLDGRPLLADLGLGRVVGEEAPAVWGTEGYVAPEVLMGADPAPAADVYALGALGWLCLTGAPPGPPGLRAPLAECCRAGDDAASLVAVLESAVAPLPHERPGAAELAWALFGSAEAVPLHLVEGEDEVGAVTYRLRAAAASGAREAPRRPGRHARRRGRTATRGRWRAAVVGVVVLSLVGAGVAAAVAGGGEPVSPVGATAPGTSIPVSPTPPAGRPGADVPPPAAATPTDPRRVRDAPARQARELLEALARARATAWRSGDPSRLTAAESRGSPLLARDTTAVEVLARSGLRYEGLRYVVGDIGVEAAGRTSAVLRARLGTSAYDVVGARSAPVAASPGEEVLVDLTWTHDGWRLAGIRAG